MSLREKLIEAGAEAVDPFMVHPLETEDASAAVLDAFLDCLGENAEGWASKSIDVWADMDNLLAVLGWEDAALGVPGETGDE